MLFIDGSQQSITAYDALPGIDRGVVPASSAVRSAVDTINSAGLLGATNQLSFSIDPATRKVVVRIVDSETHEVVSQIPTEQVLQMAASAYTPTQSDHLYA